MLTINIWYPEKFDCGSNEGEKAKGILQVAGMMNKGFYLFSLQNLFSLFGFVCFCISSVVKCFCRTECKFLYDSIDQGSLGSNDLIVLNVMGTWEDK